MLALGKKLPFTLVWLIAVVVGYHLEAEGVDKQVIVYRGAFGKNDKYFTDRGYIVDYLKKKKADIANGEVTIDGRVHQCQKKAIDLRVMNSSLPTDDDEVMSEEVQRILNAISEAAQAGIPEIHFYTYGVGILPFPMVAQIMKRLHYSEDDEGRGEDQKFLMHDVTLQQSMPVGYSDFFAGYQPQIECTHAKGKQVLVVTHACQTPKALSPSQINGTPVNCRRPSLRCYSDEQGLGKRLNDLLRKRITEVRSGSAVRSSRDELCRVKSPFFAKKKAQVTSAAAYDRSGRDGTQPISVTIHMFGDMPQSRLMGAFDLDIFTVKHYPIKTQGEALRKDRQPSIQVESDSPIEIDPEKVPEEKTDVGCCANCDDDDKEMAIAIAKVVVKVLIGVIICIL